MHEPADAASHEQGAPTRGLEAPQSAAPRIATERSSPEDDGTCWANDKQFELFAKKSVEERRADFVTAVQAHQVAPNDVIVLTYLLFGDHRTDQPVDLEALVTLYKGQSRVTAHNMLVAKRAGESFQRQHGHALKNLRRFPLFPHGVDPDLDALNSVMLQGQRAFDAERPESAAFVNADAGDTLKTEAFVPQQYLRRRPRGVDT